MYKTYTTLLAAALLSGCAVGPNYSQPDIAVEESWLTKNGIFKSDDAPAETWWTVFNDPLLSRYIEQARQHNKTLAQARANVRAARADRWVERADFLPDISANSSRTRSRNSAAISTNSSAQTTFAAGLSAAWELDLFGGSRRSVEAATARLGGQQAAYHAALLSTLADVAQHYYRVRGTQKQLAITEKNAGLLYKTFKLIDARFKAGEASEFDMVRARAQYEQTQANIPALQARLRASLYSLAVLLGQQPHSLLAEMEASQPLPSTPDVLPVGLKSTLLQRRPDVHAAERALAEATAEIGVETAALFPTFSLTGSLGSQARTFGDLLTSTAETWSFGGFIQWDLLQGGATWASIAQAKALRDGALAAYEQAVLNALADSETALNAYAQQLKVRNGLQQAVDNRKRAVELAGKLYEAGEEDFLAVLDAERELTASEDALIESETQSLLNLIDVYKALGGGWEPAAR